MQRTALLPLVFLLSSAHAFGAQSAAALAAEARAALDANELYNWCRAVVRPIPQVKLQTCLAADLKPIPVKSVEGRPIMMTDFRPGERSAGRVLLVGGIHGDELTAVSIVFRWMAVLQQRWTLGAEPYHWRVLPVLNPDGLLAKPPTRVNARGVDLNRNFPTQNWSIEAARYWSVTKRDPRRFPGTAPASEPESRWLHDEIKSFKPDVIVSVHAPHNVLDFDGPPGVKAPAQFGRLRLNRLGIYPGSLGNFGGVEEGIPVVTLELPHALEMPTEQELAHVWRDMGQWLRSNIPKRAPPPARERTTLAPKATRQQ